MQSADEGIAAVRAASKVFELFTRAPDRVHPPEWLAITHTDESVDDTLVAWLRYGGTRARQ